MLFFDAFFPIGRSNSSVPDCPRTQDQALSAMRRWDVNRALVYHTVSRDSDPEQGNDAVAGLSDPALLQVWAFDPAYVIPENPEHFLKRALAGGARAVLLNPLMRRIDLRRSPRVGLLAALLAQRRIPLLLAYWKTNPEQDLVDWYSLIDFCLDHPELPVLVWEWRTRSNRPLFDALAGAGNLKGRLFCGLILGVAESLTTGYLSGQWSNAVAFGMIMVVVLFRPEGLFGVRT